MTDRNKTFLLVLFGETNNLNIEYFNCKKPYKDMKCSPPPYMSLNASNRVNSPAVARRNNFHWIQLLPAKHVVNRCCPYVIKLRMIDVSIKVMHYQPQELPGILELH